MDIFWNYTLKKGAKFTVIINTPHFVAKVSTELQFNAPDLKSTDLKITLHSDH